MTKDDKLLILFDFYMFFVVGNLKHLIPSYCPFGKPDNSGECRDLCHSLFHGYRYFRRGTPGCPCNVFSDSVVVLHNLLVNEEFIDDAPM